MSIITKFIVIMNPIFLKQKNILEKPCQWHSLRFIFIYFHVHSYLKRTKDILLFTKDTIPLVYNCNKLPS